LEYLLKVEKYIIVLSNFIVKTEVQYIESESILSMYVYDNPAS